MEKVSISFRKFNPNFHHLREAMKDDDLRFIFLYGGSSSAKSFSVAQAILIECLSGVIILLCSGKWVLLLLIVFIKPSRRQSGYWGYIDYSLLKRIK